MTETGEVAAWLRAQAEADIGAAGKATPGPWEFEGDDLTDDELFTVHEDDSGRRVRYGDTVAYVRGGDRNVANGKHMERHDPLTETARAESALKVLAEYERAARHARALADAGCRGADTAGVRMAVIVLERVIRDLAAGYRHREGWKEAWAVA